MEKIKVYQVIQYDTGNDHNHFGYFTDKATAEKCAMIENDIDIEYCKAYPLYEKSKNSDYDIVEVCEVILDDCTKMDLRLLELKELKRDRLKLSH